MAKKNINIITEANAHCEANGLRLTEPREQVLAILAKADGPLGAYDVIDRMPEGTKPPTVYRALEFWEKEGFLHQIDSLNAYTPCRAGHRHDGAQFMICTECGSVDETHICHTPDEFSSAAKAKGFRLDGWFLELRGLCAACRKTSGKTHANAGCAQD